MKKVQILVALILLSAGICKASGAFSTTRTTKTREDPLSTYVGKYQSIQKKGAMYVNVIRVDGQLVAKASWDGSKFNLKRLSGDAFMAEGVAWAVKFIRDKNNQISEMVLQGTEHWSKVKS